MAFAASIAIDFDGGFDIWVFGFASKSLLLAVMPKGFCQCLERCWSERLRSSIARKSMILFSSVMSVIGAIDEPSDIDSINPGELSLGDCIVSGSN